MNEHRLVQPTVRGACALLSVVMWLSLSPSGAASNPSAVDRQYIVTLVGGPGPGEVAREHRDRFRADVRHVYDAALDGYAATMSAETARRVAADPRVRSVEPDRQIAIALQRIPTGVKRVDAHRSSTAKIDYRHQALDVDVAVLDTGIDTDLPDLNVVGGYNCMSPGAPYSDGHGHGTHVAGIAAAKDNLAGVVGVAPGARLWALKVVGDNGIGSWSSLICGIDWVTAHAGTIEVANLSLAGSGPDDACGDSALHSAVCTSVAAGITYVVAAGNGGSDASATVPATYDEVITVSALADFDGRPGGLGPSGTRSCGSHLDDTFATLSNYGADIDLTAPGVCIYSAWAGGGFRTLSGTSMAAPHAAGAAALYKVNNPTAKPAAVRTGLQAAATLDWFIGTDPDRMPDSLLNVASL